MESSSLQPHHSNIFVQGYLSIPTPQWYLGSCWRFFLYEFGNKAQGIIYTVWEFDLQVNGELFSCLDGPRFNNTHFSNKTRFTGI